MLVVVHKEHGFKALLHCLQHTMGTGEAKLLAGGNAVAPPPPRVKIQSWPPEAREAKCRGVSSCRCALHRFNDHDTNLRGEDIQVRPLPHGFCPSVPDSQAPRCNSANLSIRGGSKIGTTL